MSTGLPGEDPGWGKPHEMLLGLVIPWIAIRRAAKSPSMLATIRVLFTTFTTAVALIGLVVYLIGNTDDRRPAGEPSDGPVLSGTTAIVLVLVVGVVAHGLYTLISRPLACAEPGAIAAQYRARFFLRLACSELAALGGFIAFLLSKNAMSYVVGAAIAYLGFARLAPTARHLRADDDQLRAIGCPHSLYATLLATPPSSATP